MTDREYLQDRFNLYIKELKKFDIWTIDQMKHYLHISYKTIQQLISNDILYDFKISRCRFFSIYNKNFSNQQILKSIMKIDNYYRVHYDSIPNFKFDSKLESKQLIAKNIQKVGFQNDEHNCIYYNLYSIDKVTSLKDFMKIEKLLIEIFENTFESEHCFIMINIHNSDRLELEKYLENSPKLAPFLISKSILYSIIEINYIHFDYLKL